MKRFFIIFTISFFTIVSVASSASTITWVASGAGNWSNGANWSGGTAPGAGDSVIFSASSTQNATIDTNVNIAAITITSGYTGTITQNSGNTVTVGAGGYSQSGGTFSGSNSGDNITINGPFSLVPNSTFQSTSGNLLLTGASLTFDPSIFQNNSGLVTIATSTFTVTGSSTFNNLQIGNSATANIGTVNATIATDTVLSTAGYFFQYTNDTVIKLLGGGQINVGGNIEASFQPNYATGTVSIVLNGTGNQTIGAPSIFDTGRLMLPNLTINKPTGGTTLAGTIFITGDWTNSATPGTTLDPGTSTVIFGNSYFRIGPPSQIIASMISGSSTFNNLILGGHIDSGSVMFTIPTGTVLTTQGYFLEDTNGTAIQLGGSGQINVAGNIAAGYLPGWATSTVSIVLNGSGNQIVGDDSVSGLGPTAAGVVLPNFTIQKSISDSVTFANKIQVVGNFTNTNGTPISPGTSTMIIDGPTGIITGSSTFNNFQLGNYEASFYGIDTYTFATGTVITVNGKFYPYTDSSADQLFGGGEIDVKGNIIQGYVPFYATSTTKIVLTGSGNQVIGDDSGWNGGSPPDKLILPNLTVNKTGGVAYGENSLRIAGKLKVNQGEFNLATGTAVSTIEIDDAVTVANGAILSDYALASSSLHFGGSVTNNGLVFFDGNGLSCTPIIPNYVSLNSTTTGVQIPWLGSGNFIMRYVSVTDQGGTAPISVWNGTQGSNVGGNWTFSNNQAVPELIQVASSSGGANTTQLVLPAFGFPPRSGDLILVAVSAKNQTVAAPTDNAGNTYTLVPSSQTFGSSPTYAVSLYYAKNIVATSSLVVTAHGNGGSNPFLSASAFEYTGMNPSSTFDLSSVNTDISGSQTSLTSFSATGHSANELYFGAMTFDTSTVATSGSGWTSEAGNAGNVSTQALYTEDAASSSKLTVAATWTSADPTDYASVMGIFRSPYVIGYAPSGTLDSATFDTGVSSGAQLNSFLWQGTTPSNSSVKFQFAVSNASNGPWTFKGPDGTSNTYFSGAVGTTISLLSTNNGYALFNGYRYFRYRVTLFADSLYIYTPTVTQVTVNWSP